MSVYDSLQYNNPGQAFTNAFQQGQQQRRESDTQNALAKYATAQAGGGNGIVAGDNPMMGEAMADLARLDPKLAIQLQRQQQQDRLKGLEQHKDQIQIGAAILSANPPTDQASWDRVKQMAGNYGINVAELPQAWDANAQQYVQGVIAADKHLNPERDNTPSAVREYEYYQRLPQEQRAGFNQFRQSIRPQIFGSAEGGYNIYDPNQQGGAQPPQQGAPPANIASKQQYDALPPGTQYMAPDGSIRVKGGQSGSAPAGGFPPE